MADHSIQKDVHDALDKQVRELRNQLAHINKSLAKQGFDIEDVRDEAGHLMHGAAKNFGRAAHQVQKEASVVSKAARKAPATTSTILTVAGLIGFGLGYLVSQSQTENRHHRWFN